MRPRLVSNATYTYMHESAIASRRQSRQAGPCSLTVSRRVPILSRFAEVATYPALRGSGSPIRLCGRAVEEFRVAGG